MVWDERLRLAASLYEPCVLGADIGTDHAYLPWLLLREGICERMLLCDVSPKSIGQAEATVRKHHLEDRTELILADGLRALPETGCGCVSVMGMGGETMAQILLEGKDRLKGAVLVLSCHTEQSLVRRAVRDIGYRLTREELCRAGGRYYIVWRAEPGSWDPSEEELLYGSLMFKAPSSLLQGYCGWRVRVLSARLKGLRAVEERERTAIRETGAELSFYQGQLDRMEKKDAFSPADL